MTKGAAEIILLAFRRYWRYNKRLLCRATYTCALCCRHSGIATGSLYRYIVPSVHYKRAFVSGDKEDNNKRRLY